MHARWMSWGVPGLAVALLTVVLWPAITEPRKLAQYQPPAELPAHIAAALDDPRDGLARLFDDVGDRPDQALALADLLLSRMWPDDADDSSGSDETPPKAGHVDWRIRPTKPGDPLPLHPMSNAHAILLSHVLAHEPDPHNAIWAVDSAMVDHMPSDPRDSSRCWVTLVSAIFPDAHGNWSRLITYAWGLDPLPEPLNPCAADTEPYILRPIRHLGGPLDPTDADADTTVLAWVRVEYSDWGPASLCDLDSLKVEGPPDQDCRNDLIRCAPPSHRLMVGDLPLPADAE